MILRWLHEGSVVDGSTLRPPKPLHLEAIGVENPPGEFNIAQVFSPPVAWVRKFVGRGARRHVAAFPAVPKNQRDRVVYRSDRRWQLPAPAGIRGISQFMFTTNSGAESGRIRSSRFGDFQLGGGTTAGLQDPTGIMSVPITAEGKVELNTKFIPAVDPMVRIRVLTGEELAMFVVQDAVAELQAEGAPISRMADRFYAAQEVLQHRFSPPKAWDFPAYLRDTHMREDEEREFTVAVDVLDVASPAGGTGSFALLAFDAERPEDPDRRVMSEVMQLRISGDQATLTLDFYDEDVS